MQNTMEEYNPRKIEEKWQKVWEEKDVFKALDKSKKPKFYLLVEFPYPSGDGLHVGHCRSYVALDILARKKRMEPVSVVKTIAPIRPVADLYFCTKNPDKPMVRKLAYTTAIIFHS